MKKPFNTHKLRYRLGLIAESVVLFEIELDPREFDAEKRFKLREIGASSGRQFKRDYCQNYDQSLFRGADTKEMAATVEILELLFFRTLAQETTKKSANGLVLRWFYCTPDFS